MNEIKIRFKNGEIAYFKLVDEEEDIILKFYEFLGDAIKDGARGVFEAIDLSDDKKTIIDIRDISTFGYSKIEV